MLTSADIDPIQQGQPGEKQEAPEAAPAPAAAPPADTLDIKAPAPAPAAKAAETGDPALDVALSYFATKGLGEDHPAIVAADGGDFTALEAALKDQPDAGRYLNLAKEVFGRLMAEEKAASAARVALVYDHVGGEAQWNAIRDWTRTAATEAERKEATAGLQMGGLVAKAVAEYLGTRYAKSGKQTKAPAPVGQPSAGTPNTGALTAREYAQEVEKARKAHKGRTSFEDSQEYQALVARRRAYRG